MGDRAREVLENEAFVAACEAIEQELIEQWKSSPARDEVGRQSIWVMLKMHQKLLETIRSTLDTGRLAKIELEHKKTMADRAKEFLGMN